MATPAQAEPGEPNEQPGGRASASALGRSLLSALIPGFGQFAQKRIIAGLLYLAGFLGIATIAFLTRPASSYAGAIILVFVLFAFNAVSSCDAFFAPRHSDNRKPLSILLVLPLIAAFVFGCVEWASLIRLTGFMFFGVPSSSMAPAVEMDSEVVVDLRAYNSHAPARGDVVVMKKGEIYLLKRVIGLPGEVVSISGGVVSINGHPIQEPYASLGGDAGAYGRYFDSISVPENRYFVLGDNRDVSVDSRKAEFGTVSRRELVGKVLYLFGSHRIGRRVDLEQPAPIHGGPSS